MLWQSDAIVQTVSASAFLATNQGIAQEASQPMAAVEKERFLEHIYRRILKQSSFPCCVVLNVLLHQAGQPGQCIGSFNMSSWSIPGGFMILLHLSQYQTCVSKITFIHILIFLRFHCGDLASFWDVSETLKWFHYSSITMALEKWLCQHLTIIN